MVRGSFASNVLSGYPARARDRGSGDPAPEPVLQSQRDSRDSSATAGNPARSTPPGLCSSRAKAGAAASQGRSRAALGKVWTVGEDRKEPAAPRQGLRKPGAQGGREDCGGPRQPATGYVMDAQRHRPPAGGGGAPATKKLSDWPKFTQQASGCMRVRGPHGPQACTAYAPSPGSAFGVSDARLALWLK